MTVQTSPGKHAVLSRCCRAAEGFEICVNVAGVLRGVVAALAEKGRLPVKKLSMIAAMRHVARQTVLLNWGVLMEERTAFFRMAFKTKLVHRIGLDHFRCKLTVLTMALRALHEALFQGMVGLLVLLRSDVQMAAVA